MCLVSLCPQYLSAGRQSSLMMTSEKTRFLLPTLLPAPCGALGAKMRGCLCAETLDDGLLLPATRLWARKSLPSLGLGFPTWTTKR